MVLSALRPSYVLILAYIMVAPITASAAGLRAGLAKVDITPASPLRLSGYSDRRQPFDAVGEPIFVRAVAMKHGHEPVHVLVSVETVGFSAEFAERVHKRIQAKHDIACARLVLTATHTHSAPHHTESLSNLFDPPLSDDEREQARDYSELLSRRIVQAVDEAVSNLEPAKLYYAQGEASFATNRRVIDNGKWIGFGTRSEGPVDHSLPMLAITDETGKIVRGLVFNYACHCTTMPAEYNSVSGDWAGYAAKYLEESFEDAVAIPTIGCGADANPPRLPPERAVELAQMHGREIATEVERLITTERAKITAAPDARFGHVGLPIDRPSVEELRSRLGDKIPHVRRHANNMLEIHQRMGRLPESYPMPIQVWRFGNKLTMVFLGGEVCAQYALRIKRELADPSAWVTAYSNDVFGYVASEQMRAEGGYEVDRSMIYYNLPGPWSTGTEDLIIRRVHELHGRSTDSDG